MTLPLLMLKHIMEYDSSREEETAEIAAKIAKDAARGNVYCLSGDLGAGKTVFARGFLRGITDDTALDVPSPTFTLLQTYKSAKGNIYHFDLYRIKHPEEIYELGWEEARASGIILVEWPERLGDLLPKERSDIVITQTGPESRRITVHDLHTA